MKLLQVSGGVTSAPIATFITTNANGQNGYYEFTNLPNGVYVVTPNPFTIPPLLVVTTTPNLYVIDPADAGFPLDGVIDDADFGRNSGSLTPIELLYFTASRTDGGVALDWETAAEVDSAGFNIYRASAAYQNGTD